MESYTRKYIRAKGPSTDLLWLFIAYRGTSVNQITLRRIVDN